MRAEHRSCSSLTRRGLAELALAVLEDAIGRALFGAELAANFLGIHGSPVDVPVSKFVVLREDARCGRCGAQTQSKNDSTHGPVLPVTLESKGRSRAILSHSIAAVKNTAA